MNKTMKFPVRRATNYTSNTFSCTTSPLWVIQHPFINSSSQFRLSFPSLSMSSCKKFKTFLPYNLLASEGIPAAILEFPTMVTPLYIIVSLFFVSSQFPPVDAARSIITEPSLILSTISLVTNKGAFFPDLGSCDYYIRFCYTFCNFCLLTLHEFIRLLYTIAPRTG